MNILYAGFDGHIANPILGWLAIIWGIIFFIGFISLVITDKKGDAVMLGIAIALVLLGYAAMKDERYPIIKATINEEASWQEINNKYKLIEQQDQLYTFRVKGVTNEEWETYLRERENK